MGNQTNGKRGKMENRPFYSKRWADQVETIREAHITLDGIEIIDRPLTIEEVINQDELELIHQLKREA